MAMVQTYFGANTWRNEQSPQPNRWLDSICTTIRIGVIRIPLTFVVFLLQIRVVNAFRSSLYETRHYKRSMNSIASIHNFLPQINHHDDDDDDDIVDDQQQKPLVDDVSNNDVTITTAAETTTQQSETNNTVVA